MKQTNKKVVAIAAVALSTAIAAGFVALNQCGGLAGMSVFAMNRTNEYGCTSNCTGEYYPTHINQLVRANHDLSGTENVRIIAKVSHPSGWYQDVDNDTVYTSANAKQDSQFKYDWIHGMVITTSGVYTGLNGFKENDIIGFYGTINFRAKGTGYAYDTVEILNPVVYKINNKSDLSLLQPVVYLQ